MQFHGRSGALGLAAALSLLCWPEAGVPRSAAWQVDAHPTGFQMARVIGPAPVTALGVTCDGGMPVLLLEVTPQPARDVLEVQLRIGDEKMRQSMFFNRSVGLWVGEIRDAGFVDSLAGGSVAQVTIAGISVQKFPLDGAGEALREVCPVPNAEQAPE